MMPKICVYAPEMLSLSLCDYAGEPSCVVFFSGCNYGCGYCYNWRLKRQGEAHLVELDAIKERIRGNKLISACKVTGGEPLLQDDALRELGLFIRTLGLKFGIDTNGSLPGPLRSVLPLLDLVSLDIKTALDETSYRKVIGEPIAANVVKQDAGGKECVESVKESLAILLSSDVYADLRMVIIPGYNDSDEVMHSVSDALREAGYEKKASLGKASFTLVEFIPEEAWLEEFKQLKNTTVESLRSLALASGLENIRITHRAAGFCKKVK